MTKEYYVNFISGGIERVGDYEFEDKLTKLAKKCNGEFTGAGYNFLDKERDYSFIFKSRRSADRFMAELGRRARVWNISKRDCDEWKKWDLDTGE